MLIGVSYDLNRIGQKYKALDAALRRATAQRVIETFWIVKANSVADVHKYVEQYFDDNDEWMVFEMTQPIGRLDKEDWQFLAA